MLGPNLVLCGFLLSLVTMERYPLGPSGQGRTTFYEESGGWRGTRSCHLLKRCLRVEYFLTGFSNGAPGVRKYLAVAAFMAMLVEELLLSLLQDDRLLRRLSAVGPDLDRLVKCISDLPDLIWT